MLPRDLRRLNIRRAAPVLPNGFTLGNLFCGIFAIVSASRGEFAKAVLLIVIGGTLDAFDGRVARATGTGSRFGEELDSLVDAISFGLAPAMIVYFAVLSHEGWGWLPVFIFCACAVVRLARFNVTQAGAAKSYFIGLPSPAAGGTLATYYWFSQTPLYNQTMIGDLPWQQMMQFLMFALAGLMVSNVPYPAWPRIGFKGWQALLGLLFAIVTIVGVVNYHQYYFFLAGVGYAAFGLLRAFVFGLADRVPTGESSLLEPEYVDADDDAGELLLASPYDQPAGRRRRKKRRPRGDMPTPPVNHSVTDPDA